MHINLLSLAALLALLIIPITAALALAFMQPGPKRLHKQAIRSRLADMRRDCYDRRTT